MQRDLVRLASGRAVGEEAGEAIWTIWHGENLGALERAVEAMEGRPEGEKLRRLVSEIRRRRQRASPGE